jgi:serine/threonine protein kinase
MNIKNGMNQVSENVPFVRLREESEGEKILNQIKDVAFLYFTQNREKILSSSIESILTRFFYRIHYSFDKSQYIEIQDDKNQGNVLIRVKKVVHFLNESINQKGDELRDKDIKNLIKGKNDLNSLDRIKQVLALRNTQQVINTLTQQYHLKTLNNEIFLISKSGEPHLSLKLDTLNHVIYQFEMTKKLYYEEKNTKARFIGRRDENGNLLIYRYQVLKNGAVAKISEIGLINSAKFMVLKRIKAGNKKKINLAKEEIVNAYRLLEGLHKSRDEVLGIQDRPYRLVKINSFKSHPEQIIDLMDKTEQSDRVPDRVIDEDVNADIEREYEDDYSKRIQENNSSVEDIFYEFYQLLYGVNYLKEHKIIHLDIKPENILISSDQNEKPRVYISDFGGASKEKAPGGIGNGLIPFQDWEKKLELLGRKRDLENNQQENSNKIDQEQLELYQKGMDYQIGIVLYQRIALQTAYQVESRGLNCYPIHSPKSVEEAQNLLMTSIQRLSLKIEQQERLGKLIMGMIHPTYQERLSSLTGLGEMENLIKEACPHLQELIRQKTSNPI